MGHCFQIVLSGSLVIAALHPIPQAIQLNGRPPEQTSTLRWVLCSPNIFLVGGLITSQGECPGRLSGSGFLAGFLSFPRQSCSFNIRLLWGLSLWVSVPRSASPGRVELYVYKVEQQPDMRHQATCPSPLGTQGMILNMTQEASSSVTSLLKQSMAL